MLIQSFPSGPFSTNAYIIGCPLTKEAAIVDPAPNSAKELLAFLNHHQLKCEKILLTHSHWDHIADISTIRNHLGFSIPIYVHSLDKDNLIKPGSDGLPFWIPIQSVEPNILLQEDDNIKIGQYHFRVIHTPGHSPGSICFYCSQENVLFSGDTLFAGTIGNLSFPTSQPDLMWTSLAKLDKLPPHTIVYPGHGKDTTIGRESWLPQAKQLFS